MWSLGGSQQPFSYVLGHFRHSDNRTNEQPNNRVILVQACSWPVRRQSFAINYLTNNAIQFINQQFTWGEHFCLAWLQLSSRNPPCSHSSHLPPSFESWLKSQTNWKDYSVTWLYEKNIASNSDVLRIMDLFHNMNYALGPSRSKYLTITAWERALSLSFLFKIPRFCTFWREVGIVPDLEWISGKILSWTEVTKLVSNFEIG